MKWKKNSWGGRGRFWRQKEVKPHYKTKTNGIGRKKPVLKKVNLTFLVIDKMNLMTFQMMEIISVIETYAWSEVRLDEMVSYGTDAYGAHWRHSRSADFLIHLRVILLICSERDRNVAIIWNKQLYYPVKNLLRAVTAQSV
jgi:hypothetical protein